MSTRLGARRRVPLLLLAAALAALGAAGAAAQESTADHSKFAQLRGPFKDGPAVTRACLTCHNQAGAQIKGTPHWDWLGPLMKVPGHDKPMRLGKANVLNNFCIGIQSNEASCTKCHISYGGKDEHFAQAKDDRIDCLVCHDRTGDYTKTPPADEPLDYARIAQHVGQTSTRSCGSCHFNGGGGEGVKHGDLDESLLTADRKLDVHMAREGLAFDCTACHRGDEVGHRIKGHMPSVDVGSGNRVTCQQCHGNEPHGRDFIFRSSRWRDLASSLAAGPERGSFWQSMRRNWHERKLACQTCHIPDYARNSYTRVSWDWSKAGRLRPDGRPVIEFDEHGNEKYWGIKGAFTWGTKIVPTYLWWDGRSGRYLLGDRFDPQKPLDLNKPIGSPDDPRAKIWPFKIHHSIQPYDPVNDMLIQPHLAGDKGSGAYWADFNWKRASALGMKHVGLPFSGRVAFTRTEMYWPINHMVVQGHDSLSCVQCHSRQGRLAGVEGVYIPGRDRSKPIEAAGWLLVWGSLLGVGHHGVLLARSRRKNKRRKA